MSGDDEVTGPVDDTTVVEVSDAALAPIVVDDSPPDGPKVGDPIHHKQEKTRGRIALTLTAIFAGTVLATFLTAFFAQGDADWAKLSNILEVLLPAEMALLGSALGFYFGAKTD